MSEVRENLKYAKTHEWINAQGTEVTVGVTAHAVEALDKDIVFVELPSAGTAVTQNSPFGVIEAVKAAYDLYAPVSGTVIAVNERLESEPELVANSPYEEGWMIRIDASDLSELDLLMEPDEYRAMIEDEDDE